MTSSQYPGGLVETRLGLHFRVTRQHFLGGEMTVRCSAKISSLYYKTQQHSVDGHMTYSVPSWSPETSPPSPVVAQELEERER
ncbi:uncharacterized protein [Procambarus clarkii]|uniref:uncharacterized protein n=1 Tax=Procambarus clarkii TaxID=6728 RepID=UPI003743D82F